MTEQANQYFGSVLEEYESLSIPLPQVRKKVKETQAFRSKQNLLVVALFLHSF
jgi:hypothetical protein